MKLRTFLTSAVAAAAALAFTAPAAIANACRNSGWSSAMRMLPATPIMPLRCVKR